MQYVKKFFLKIFYFIDFSDSISAFPFGAHFLLSYYK